MSLRVERISALVKVTFGLIGCGVLAWAAGHRAYVALREPAATAYDVRDFPRTYRGERWLKLTGRLATEAMVVRRSKHKAHENKDLSYAHVPLVRPEWQAGEPIDVLVTLGPLPSSIIRPEIESRAKGSAGVAQIAGVVGPGLDRAELFGGTTFGQPFVWVNEGGGPGRPALALTLLALSVVAFSWLLAMLWRGLRASPRTLDYA